jgi:heme-degrading monooxygenase HmoA
MYMRLVQAKIKPDKLSELRQHYDQKAIPALKKMPGCVYACLMHSVQHPDESISLTLWETQQYADAYEQSGVFQQLLHEAQPFLAEASEWKIQLSEELKLEYLPVPEEPVVKSYTVAATTKEQNSPQARTAFLYLRIVSPKIMPEKLEEFKRLYNEEIIPVLRTVKGCRYAYLTEGVKDNSEVISITLWDSKEDAENYERSGLFNKLTEKVKHTFSELYQWKMGLEREFSGHVATSEDLKVEHYQIVTATSFQ